MKRVGWIESKMREFFESTKVGSPAVCLRATHVMLFVILSLTLVLQAFAASDIRHERLEIPTAGFSMPATLSFPAGAGPFPTVVILPGGNAAKIMGVAWPYHHLLAEELCKRGYATLVLDYSSQDRQLWDPRREADIGAALNYVKSRSEVDTSQINLLGLSMGGSLSLLVASARKDVAHLVVYFPAIKGAFEPKNSPLDAVKGIACPVLILQGEQDEVTDQSQAKTLHEALTAAGKKSKLVLYKGAGHGFNYKDAPKAPCCRYDSTATAKSLEDVDEFLKQK